MNIFAHIYKRQNRRRSQKEFEARLNEMGLHFPLFCKAHAVKSPERQGALAQSRDGDNLQLVHTPTEEYPFCITIYSIPLNRILGYLGVELSEKLVHAFGEGFCCDGEIENVTGGPPYKYYGCNLRIMDTQELFEDIEDILALYGE